VLTYGIARPLLEKRKEKMNTGMKPKEAVKEEEEKRLIELPS
jgi:hypothetical protein